MQIAHIYNPRLPTYYYPLNACLLNEWIIYKVILKEDIEHIVRFMKFPPSSHNYPIYIRRYSSISILCSWHN